MFKCFYIIIILANIFSCKEKKTDINSIKKSELKDNTFNRGLISNDSIIYSTSKTCKDVEYKIELNHTDKTVIIDGNNNQYNISASKLIEEISDKEMVNDFQINCECIPNGLKLNYTLDLFLYKNKSKLHYIHFKNKDVFITKAFNLYSDRNEETIFGHEFKEKPLYSYDAIDKIENEFIKLISFQNFQNEDYEQNIDDYFNNVKNLYNNKYYKKLILKADTLVLSSCLKNVPFSKNLTKYNDIAYYLEQSGAYKEAIFLLKKITKEFPDRTVAYINLGDAYWGLGDKEKAKKAYKTYVEQMKKSGKETKIPKTILDRI